MRKIFLSFVFAITAFVANAQFTVIPKIGFSTANIVSSPTPNSAVTTTGIQLGLACDMRVTDIFSIQPELLFIQKGKKNKTSSVIGSASSTHTLNYLEIPLLAKLKFGNDNVKFYVAAGPSLGILVSADYKSVFGNSITREKFDVGWSKDDDYKPTDIGAQFGAGLMLGNFVFDVRYGLGLSNIFPDDNASDYNEKNRAFGITIGYAIAL